MGKCTCTYLAQRKPPMSLKWQLSSRHCALALPAVWEVERFEGEGGSGAGGGSLQPRIADLPLASTDLRLWDPGTLLEVDYAITGHWPLDK